MSRPGFIRRHAVAVNLALVLGLLGLASLVPPDGSLAAVRARGVLRVCMPVQGPGEAEAAWLEAFAAAIPARLSSERLASIGADANPRNWRLTRAQCDMIAGGLADTPATRSFLAVVPIGVRTGWAVWPGPLEDCRAVAVWPGTSGLSRVALSGFLRARQSEARLVRDLPTAVAEIMAETMAGTQTGTQTGVQAGAGPGACIIAPLADLLHQLPPDAAPRILDLPGAPAVDLGFGFWKGDATLARRMRNVVVRSDK